MRTLLTDVVVALLMPGFAMAGDFGDVGGMVTPTPFVPTLLTFHVTPLLERCAE